ncbi:MAG: alpha/beta fold hydrolase [Anaerolineae bacterium]|nr:alpha/beta fold hydrolase [Anaerolineae bacterium]
MKLRLFAFALTLVCLLSFAGMTFAQDSAPINDGETVITLENGVVGTLNIPESDSPVPAVLMLHGFASSRNEVGDMYLRLAAALAERGVGSLRIDFSGWGESAGDMAASTVSGMVDDAELALAYLQGVEGIDASRLGILGFSLGGGITVFTAGENPDAFKSMALWSTFGNLRDIFLEELGQDNFDAAAANGTVEIDLGWRMVTLGNDFFTGLEAYDYQTEFPKYTGSFMVVAGSEDGSAEFLDWYRENAQGALRASYLVPGADHIYNVLTEDQALAEATIKATADWFALSL